MEAKHDDYPKGNESLKTEHVEILKVEEYIQSQNEVVFLFLVNMKFPLYALANRQLLHLLCVKKCIM